MVVTVAMGTMCRTCFVFAETQSTSWIEVHVSVKTLGTFRYISVTFGNFRYLQDCHGLGFQSAGQGGQEGQHEALFGLAHL
jgi:hypothetical protein